MIMRFASLMAAFVSTLMALWWKPGMALKSPSAHATPPPPPTWQSGAMRATSKPGSADSAAACAALTPPLVGYMNVSSGAFTPGAARRASIAVTWATKSGFSCSLPSSIVCRS